MKRETWPDRCSHPIPRRLGRPRVAVLLVALFLPLASAFAGGGTRILEGRVVDAQGRPLPGVTVSAGSVVAVSDALGTFRLLDRFFLDTVTASFVLDGFDSVQLQGELRDGQPTTIEVTMTLAAVTEELIVTAQAPIVDSSPTQAGATISEDLLDALPQARSFASYLQLLPARDGSPSRIQAVGGTGSPITDIYEASTPAARLYSTDSILFGDPPPATSLELLIPFLETTSVADLLLQTNPIDLDLGILPGGPPTRIGPAGSFYGPPDLGGNGFLAAANLDSQLFDVYDLFADPPRMVGSFSSGGFQNSLFTGGHDPALDFSGGEIRGFFDRAPSSDVRDLGNGCTQYYPFSELVLKTLVWNVGSGQFVNTDTRSLGTRPGPFGPGCYDVGSRTDVFRLGDWSVFQYRRGNLLSFQPYDGTMLGSAFTAMLPPGYEQIEYVPNSYADQATGIALTVLPDGIWEIAVTDSVSGSRRSYSHPGGSAFATITDVEAFACP